MSSRRGSGDGALFQRGSDGRWVGRIELGWVGGKRRQRVVYGKTRAEAQRALRTAIREAEAGVQATRQQTVEQWLATWLLEVVPTKERMGPATMRAYRTSVTQYIVPAIGRVKLTELAPRHVRDLHRYVMKEKGLSTTTAHHAHDCLSTALADAMREGLLPRNVARLVNTPPLQVPERRAMTIHEAHAVYQAALADRWASRWIAALLLGLRPGEALGLQWSHVQTDHLEISWQLQRISARQLAALPAGFEHRHVTGTLYLQRPKMNKPRLVPLPGVLADLLHRHYLDYLTARDDWKRDHGLVWTEPDGRPIEAKLDRQRWHRLLDRAGVESCDLYTARHTCATLLLAMGVPDDIRMAILGHSVASTTAAYTHVDLGMSGRAIANLGQKMALGSAEE